VFLLAISVDFQHVATSPANPRAMPLPEGMPAYPEGPPARYMKHLCQSLRALHMLIIGNPSVEDEIVGRARVFLPPLFYLLEASEVPCDVQCPRPRRVSACCGSFPSRSPAAVSCRIELCCVVVLCGVVRWCRAIVCHTVE
jgi:hypothetical protein